VSGAVNKSILDEALEAWEGARHGVIAELENIPANRFDFRPTPEVRSVTELAVHIMEVSLMMVGELTQEETDFTRVPFPKLIAKYSKEVAGLRTKRELLPALRRTLTEGVRRLRTAGEIHMLQTLVRFDGRRGTRLSWLYHGIDQEMYHRGQLALYARLIGITPALTKRIRGE
jgi:uncharacterized damage-inducible protein DinB